MVITNPTTLWTGCRLLVDKPLEWTSFDVVNKLRIALKLPGKKTRVGHAGTLDPLATGLLLICTGSATKTIQELQGLEKEYTGTFRLGATTPSFDAETAVDAAFDISAITPEAIRETAASFLGWIEQLPPAHSAVKIDGTRAYKMARAGKEVALRKRLVEIKRFHITGIDLPDVDFDIQCSKGTYIRSLASDFGKRLDNGAYLTALRRTAIGPYRVEDAWNLDELVDFIRGHRDAASADFTNRR